MEFFAILLVVLLFSTASVLADWGYNDGPAERGHHGDCHGSEHVWANEECVRQGWIRPACLSPAEECLTTYEPCTTTYTESSTVCTCPGCPTTETPYPTGTGSGSPSPTGTGSGSPSPTGTGSGSPSPTGSSSTENLTPYPGYTTSSTSPSSASGSPPTSPGSTTMKPVPLTRRP